MQMILLAFALIAICAAHLKWQNGSTFKLQGGTEKEKNMNNARKFEDLGYNIQYIALSNLVTLPDSLALSESLH